MASVRSGFSLHGLDAVCLSEKPLLQQSMPCGGELMDIQVRGTMRVWPEWNPYETLILGHPSLKQPSSWLQSFHCFQLRQHGGWHHLIQLGEVKPRTPQAQPCIAKNAQAVHTQLANVRA